jgi:hypothetical protein
MQYILDQDEYDDLTGGRGGTQIGLTKNQLQKLCTKIADEMPVLWGWVRPKDDVPKPWGCVITAEKNGDEWYCDKCPVQDICPSDSMTYSK